MRKIGVYGSLRQSMYNHDLLQNSQLVETKTVNVPFKMVPFGGYPALIPDNNKSHDVVFEVYEVDDDVYRSVEMLEGYPDFYQKAWSANGSFEYYYVPDKQKYYQSRFEDEDHIPDWVEYMRNLKFNTIQLTRCLMTMYLCCGVKHLLDDACDMKKVRLFLHRS